MIKNFHYEEQPICTRIYLAQVHQSFTDYLASTFQLQLHTFFFRSTLEVHTKLYIGSFWIYIRRKWVFTQTQINKNTRNEWKKWISPFFRKSNCKTIWKSSWKRIFLKNKHFQFRLKRESLMGVKNRCWCSLS